MGLTMGAENVLRLILRVVLNSLSLHRPPQANGCNFRNPSPNPDPNENLPNVHHRLALFPSDRTGISDEPPSRAGPYPRIDTLQ